jgi:hypothetical protein
MARVLGVLVLLGALACAGFAFLDAGGLHGEFRPAQLFSRAPLFSAGAIGLLVLSVMLFVAGGWKKKPAP